MLRKLFILLSLVFLFSFLSVLDAQTRKVSYYYSIEVIDNDTVITATLPQVTIYPQLKFKNEEEWKEYAKLVRDVKRTLPYANQIALGMMETYEFMETLPDKKSKEKHLKEAQKYIVEEYKPKMKKLSKKQGKILVKLINRQTNSSAYDIVKAIIGPLKATVYNTLASVYGNNLKNQYDPNGEDQMIERIIIEIQQGTL